MKSLNHKREPKKKPGLFAEKRKRNKARRSRVIALLLGGKEWADKVAPLPSEAP